MTTLKERLEEIRAQERALAQEKRKIYAASVRETDPALKVATDGLCEALAEAGPPILTPPFEVHGIAGTGRTSLQPWTESERQPHPWVSIRPVGEEHEGKTFLGVMLGDIATDCVISLSEDGVLSVGPGRGNPAIYVPELRRVVFGYESWWGYIDGPDELREITDETINGIWYVQALKAMHGGAEVRS